jgi:DNA-binding beta-propeller fold protein YncE
MRPWMLALSLLALVSPPSTGHVALVAGEGLREPFGVDFDRAGNTYVVEMGGNRVSVIDKTGKLRAIAGTGEAGFSGDDGPAVNAKLSGPHHLLFGPDGSLYIADTGNGSVRKIDLKTGIITRVAGTGLKGFNGDGKRAIDTQFGGIYAIAFWQKSLYICDLDNRLIRMIDPATGLVATVAGNGSKGVPQDGAEARTQPLVDPRAIAIDRRGNLYILERSGHALRVVDPSGKIRTVAGTGEAGYSGDDGPARAAKLNGPKSISVDGNDVLIADTENHMIRRYSPRDGRITRVVGTGKQGTNGIGGPPDACELNRPHGAQRQPTTGLLYISDSENHRVLRIDK